MIFRRCFLTWHSDITYTAAAAQVGLNPMVTLEKLLLNMIVKLG